MAYVSVGIAGVAIFSALALGVFQNSDNIANAEQPQIIRDLPVGTDNILKVKSLDVKEKVSKNAGIDVLAESKLTTPGIAFKAINKAGTDSNLGVDAWKLSVDGAVIDVRPSAIPVLDSTLKAGETRVVYEFHFADYFEQFEEYPGIYNVTLLGFDTEYSLAKDRENEEQDIEVENDELAVYKVKATVVIGFDENLIRTKGHVLKAKNVQTAVDGVVPFVITDNEKRNVIVSIVNNEPYPVSRLVSYVSYNIMNVELTKAVGSDRIGEYLNNECMLLQPGESKVIRTFTLGKDIPPLGGEGESLSNKMGNGNAAAAGTYILEVEGGTKPCAIGDEEVPGMIFESMIAFEVQ
jgi:hypothetical protein